MTKGWLKLEKSLLKVVLVKNLMSGEMVEWSYSHTILFLYLKDRHDHFKRIGNEFFDNQEQIALDIGLSIASLKRKMRDLYRLGAVRVEKKKMGGFINSNSYTVLDIFSSPMFESITVDGEVLEKHVEVQNKELASKRVPKTISPTNIYDDEAPF